MKRNGRAKNGVEAKRRRARIARRLKLVDERRVVALSIAGVLRFEEAAFARMYRPILSSELLADLESTFAE